MDIITNLNHSISGYIERVETPDNAIPSCLHAYMIIDHPFINTHICSINTQRSKTPNNVTTRANMTLLTMKIIVKTIILVITHMER